MKTYSRKQPIGYIIAIRKNNFTNKIEAFMMHDDKGQPIFRDLHYIEHLALADKDFALWDNIEGWQGDPKGRYQFAKLNVRPSLDEIEEPVHMVHVETI